MHEKYNNFNRKTIIYTITLYFLNFLQADIEQ